MKEALYLIGFDTIGSITGYDYTVVDKRAERRESSARTVPLSDGWSGNSI